MAELARIEKVSHLRIFTHNIKLKIRKITSSCCDCIGFRCQLERKFSSSPCHFITVSNKLIYTNETNTP